MIRFAAGVAFAAGLMRVYASAQAHEMPIAQSQARQYFEEAQTLCDLDHGRLWGVSLCGPIMFVDPQSRYIVANKADANGVLKAEGNVFVGYLPKDQNVANTATKWSGVRWTQILWPLPNDQRLRDTLIAHELFHRIQDQLKLPNVPSGDNAQLDTVDGRYYLQLEWRALARALEARTEADRRQAAKSALLFRAERYRLFPQAVQQERALELNEGLAEYTGVRVGNPSADEQVSATLNDLQTQSQVPTFVRSFAYATGPSYGLLLDRYDPGWRLKLADEKGLGDLLQGALQMSLPPNLQQAARQEASQYNSPALKAAEIQRDVKRQQVIAQYREQLIDGPVLILTFKNMHVQFDPRNLQPLGEAGTVYPTMRITDSWGVLEASKGALMKPDWSAVVVRAPATSNGMNIKGDGWTLELKPGWRLVAGPRHGDLMLQSGT